MWRSACFYAPVRLLLDQERVPGQPRLGSNLPTCLSVCVCERRCACVSGCGRSTRRSFGEYQAGKRRMWLEHGRRYPLRLAGVIIPSCEVVDRVVEVRILGLAH